MGLGFIDKLCVDHSFTASFTSFNNSDDDFVANTSNNLCY